MQLPLTAKGSEDTLVVRSLTMQFPTTLNGRLLHYEDFAFSVKEIIDKDGPKGMYTKCGGQIEGSNARAVVKNRRGHIGHGNAQIQVTTQSENQAMREKPDRTISA